MRFLLLACFVTTSFLNSFGQARPDTAFRQEAIRFAVAQAVQADTSTDALMNGGQFMNHDRRLRGHSYFGTDTAYLAQINAGGRVYTLPIHYDLVDDAVIADHRAGYWMVPRGETIQSFRMINHTFIRLTDSTQANLRAGFYDLLYDGPSRLLARRVKKMLINPTANHLGEYQLVTTYYLFHQGQYVPVGSRKALIKLLTDRRKELTTYAREQKARFNEDPEGALSALARRYDELNQAQ